MKRGYLLFALCVFASMLVFAAPRYWIGPLNGNWNNDAYWSATNGGPGGAGVPGIADSVIFNNNALVNVDVSPIIQSLRIDLSRAVTFYTAVPTTFTVIRSLVINPLSVLKDSTSADVLFNFVFNEATNATASIFGNWIFEGGVPVTGNNGATFTANGGTRVLINSIDPLSSPNGIITVRKNAGIISSNPATLIFRYNTRFVLDNHEGEIPNATWFGDSLRTPIYSGFLGGVASTILITGSIGELKHAAGTPSYGRFIVDLPLLTENASLAFTHGTRIKSNLDILNTNNQTLTLLSAIGPSSYVEVEVGLVSSGVTGGLTIRGNSKVALATATSAAPATSYRLQVNKTFSQTGGNFSLQDFDGSLGTSTLAVTRDLMQTGGTFYTNSIATGAATKFVVEMDDPYYITGPSGVFFSLGRISMSSGTIDNGRGMVTLRLDHTNYYNPGNPNEPNGVSLLSPLTTGRLELFRSPLNTTLTNIITITDPNPATAVSIGSTGTSYVNGPLRRWTNSTNAYVFPTGKGNTGPASFVFDSCVVIPVNDETSLYQAEYFKTRYADTSNVRPPLRGVSTAEYWDISKISGAGAQVKLIVNARVPLTTDSDVLTVAHYVNGEWVSEQGSLLIPGNATSGSVVSKPLSDFSPFTFGYYAFTNNPPVTVNCPSNLIVNTDPNSCSALVEFKAESSDNSSIVYKTGSTVITSPYTFPKGTTIVDVTASDNISTATCSFTVTVNDAQAPVIISLSADPATLSPADNLLKNVYINYTVTENCGPVTTTLSVTSNQPPTGSNVDWEIIDDHNVRLRAGQSGEDRIYTIAITSTDESGNQTLKTVDVTVPKATVTEKIKLDLKVMPNPSKTYYTLYVRSNSDKPATLQVFDVFGRVKEVRRFYPDATIRLGDNYRPGVYFVKITQGNSEVYTALLKLPG